MYVLSLLDMRMQTMENQQAPPSWLACVLKLISLHRWLQWRPSKWAQTKALLSITWLKCEQNPLSELPIPSVATMAVFTHLQDGQAGDFIFFEFLLVHFVFLFLRGIFYSHHYLVWFCLCRYLVEIVRLLVAVELRRDRAKLPLSLCSGTCYDPSFQKEIVAFCCRIVTYSPAVCELQDPRRCHLHINTMSTGALEPDNVLACLGLCRNSLS